MTKLSAVIITANEAKNMHRCLQSLLGVVDEIVVMDSFSTDATKEICAQYPVLFFQQEWKGYGPQKNDAHAKTSHDYILSIDADEELSEELRNSILKQKEIGLDGVYELKRLSSFCGRFIRYGAWNPELKIRIFNKMEVSWNNREVHETLEIPAPTKITRLAGPLIHYTSNTIEERVATGNKYSTLGAKVYWESGKKSSLLKIILKPWAHFLNGFFIRRGFMDGYHGFILALLLAYEVFLKYAKLYELQKSK
jgi:glycosyltransferase involved in cell wall biosynthesis